MRYMTIFFALAIAFVLLACSSGDPDPAVTLYQSPGDDAGDRVVIDPDDFALEFRFDFEPRNAETECRFQEGDWFPCVSPYTLTDTSEEHTVEEGYLNFEVRSQPPEEDPSPPQGVEILVLFDFDVTLDGADEYEPDSADTPFYFPDEYTASCTRNDCEIGCFWDADGMEELTEVECTLEEPFELEFPGEEFDDAYLLLEACATDFGGDQNDEHCQGPKTYLFYPAPPEFVALDSGRRHNCGLVEDGSLWCWGHNNAGQVGVGSTDLEIPVATQIHPSSLDWSMVTTGREHTCALNDSSELYCWGENASDQLGFDPVDHRQAEAVDSEHGPWKTVSAGGSHTCAIDAEQGGLWCWGSNSSGQLGSDDAQSGPEMHDVALPGGTANRWCDVSAGEEHTCATALRSGDDCETNEKAAFCWGNASGGRLGNGQTSGSFDTPQEVVGDLGTWNTVALTTGSEHSCAIATSGSTRRAYCWGEGSRGRLGAANDDTWPTPERVDNGDDYHQIAAGEEHSCAVHDDGTIYCWGENVWNQLGTGGERTNVPEAVDVDGIQFDHVATGEEHSCGIDTSGFLYCWGESDHGRLGVGDDGEGSYIGAETPTEIAWPQGEFVPQPGE